MMFHVKHLRHALKAMIVALGVGTGSFSASAARPVTFPGDGVELAAIVYVPVGKGPFPAVVLMHGCSGLWAGPGRPTLSYAFWAEHLRSRGFIALLVDSFGPRGEKEICTQRNRRISESRDRPRDAYSAQRWLAARADVDPQRIHVMGWSNGAMAVLHAVMPDAAGGGQPRFRSAVAFYPGCRNLLDRRFRSTAPLLI
jgi:dienelactone hydrolase